MIEQQAAKSSESYCEVCGIDVTQNTDLKRFGRFFCSQEHMQLYVEAKQRQLGLGEQEQYPDRRRERRWFGGC